MVKSNLSSNFINCTNTVFSNDVICNSDERLKRNVLQLNIPHINDIIMKLNPVSYQFSKNDIPDTKHYGLIAQDVHKINELSNLVQPNKHDQLGVNYIELISLLIHSQQKCISEIKKLKKEIDEIKNLT